MAEYYCISSLAEARAYLAHPVLGARLDLCTRTVLESDAASLHAIFGSPDDMKFRSSCRWAAARVGELLCSPITLPRLSLAGPEEGALGPLS